MPEGILELPDQCSYDSQDCRFTRCCKDKGHHCYEKNQVWATCKKSCKEGINWDDPKGFQTPWTCEVLSRPRGPTTTTTLRTTSTEAAVQTTTPAPAPDPTTTAAAPSPRICSGTKADCRTTRCCIDPGAHCYRKNSEWSGCRVDCQPGQVDPDDLPKWRTPWGCELQPPLPEGVPIPAPSPHPTPAPAPRPPQANRTLPSAAAPAPEQPTNARGGGKSSPGHDNPVVVIDIFRAMSEADVDKYFVEDDDIADLGGVLKYVHTETIAEHLLPPLRQRRKYDIDCITRHRYKVRNPPALLGPGGPKEKVDFGQFVTYDYGVATNLAQIPMIKKYGDFVGIQDNRDPRYPSSNPYYWFSAGNRCPNLAWNRKGSRKRPNPQCLAYAGGGYVAGGLCPGGFDRKHTTPQVDPTGAQGCIYSYGRTQLVRLDELAGITSEDCGGRKCKDWLDFRKNCTNKAYKRQFVALSGDIVETDYCVEYDVHPICEPNCHTKQCQALLSSGKPVELGLPFWHSRCNARANHHRMETFSLALGVKGAGTRHQLVDDEILNLKIPCVREGDWSCRPSGPGGPYCSRRFSGVCERCYLPGTLEGPDPTPLAPLCPFDIFGGSDYGSNQPTKPPKCKSRRPRDLCCLYTDSCLGDSDPRKAPLDDDGLALVAARRNTADMAAFLRRAVLELPRRPPSPAHLENLSAVAYYEWAHGPTGRTLNDALTAVGVASGFPPAWQLSRGTSATATIGHFDDALIFRRFLVGRGTVWQDGHWAFSTIGYTAALVAGLLCTALAVVKRHRRELMCTLRKDRLHYASIRAHSHVQATLQEGTLLAL